MVDFVRSTRRLRASFEPAFMADNDDESDETARVTAIFPKPDEGLGEVEVSNH